MSDLTAATIEYRACWKSPSAAQLDVRRVTDYDDEHLTMFWEWVADCAAQVPDRIYWVEARAVTDWTTDLAAPRDQTDDGLICCPECESTFDAEDNTIHTESASSLAELIWRTSRADEGTISATGANFIARTIMAAGYTQTEDGLAERVRALTDPDVMQHAMFGAATDPDGVLRLAAVAGSNAIRDLLADQPDTTASEEDQR